MANKNEVTISTDEYKELVSKGMPNEKEKWFRIKLEEFLEEQFKIDGEKLDVKNNWNFGNLLEEWLKIVDKEMYKRIYNKLYDEKIKKENDKMKMEKARAIKKLNEKN